MELWPNSIRESQCSTCKELKNSSMMFSRHRRIISLPKYSSKRSTRRYNNSCDAFPEQTERYRTLFHLRYLWRWWPKGMTSCQGENWTSNWASAWKLRAIICMNWGGRSESANYIKKKQFSDDLREAQVAFFILHNWKGSIQRHHRNSRD